MRLIFIISIILLVLLTACTVQTTKEDTLKIGVIVPLSGNGAIYGEWGRRSLDMATDEINAKGGVGGNKLELIYEDGKFSPSETVTSFHKLVRSDNVGYVITLGSSPAVAVSPVANDAKVIQMDFSATTTEYRSEGDYTFRTAPQAEQFGIDAAKWLIDNSENEVSMLYIDNDQGVSIHEAFKAEYEKLGGDLLKAEKFDQDGADYRTIISKAVLNENHYIFLIGHLKESGLLIKQMNELGHKNPILSHVFSIEGDTFLRTAGEFNNEIIYLAPDYKPDKNSDTKVYNEEYKKRYGENSEYFGAFAYDAINVLTLAISKCEDFSNTDCVKEELFKIKGYKGLTGEITFDKYGDRIVDLTLKTVKDGEFVEYK